MIFGIGTDICDIRRRARHLARRGERFAEARAGADELEVFRSHAGAPRRARGVSLPGHASRPRRPSKAIGLGMRMPMTWRACEILNAASGKPRDPLHGALAGGSTSAACDRARQRHRRNRLRGVLRRRETESHR